MFVKLNFTSFPLYISEIKTGETIVLDFYLRLKVLNLKSRRPHKSFALAVLIDFSPLTLDRYFLIFFLYPQLGHT